MTIPIPAAALSQHVVCLGKTGSGKSSKLRVLVEHQLERDLPVTIIDPKGDWWGLKSSADGKKDGFPIVIFGGEHADVSISEVSGAHVAELLANSNRSALIDLGGWMVGERTRFFIEFASTYFKLMRGARTLVLPEAHNFAPQGKIMDPAAGKMLHWANRLASEGRGKGLTILADSQRPQKVHKDFLTSCETLIACRVIHKLDRDAIKDWIDGCADAAAGKRVLSELAQMQRADAWVWSPEIEFGPQRITWPMFKTFDSFKPQSADTGKLKGWAEVDLDEVRAKLVTVVMEAEANDPKRLQRRIKELERQLSDEARPTREDVRRNETEFFDKGYAAASAAIGGSVSGVVRAAEAFLEQLRHVSETIQNATPRPNSLQRLKTMAEKRHNPITMPLLSDKNGITMAKESHNNAATTGLGASRATVDASLGDSGKRRMLVALAQQTRPIDQRRLSLLTGLSARSGTWSTYLSSLRSSGYIDGRNELSITPAGLSALGSYQPLPTGDALIEYWREKLGASGKRAIFDTVVAVYPREIDQDDVATTTNLSSRSGTWSTYLSELRGLGLIEGRKMLRASEDLFA